MRPTASRLVRVVPRNLLKVNEQKIYMRPRSQMEDQKQPTIIDMLSKKKKEAGKQWPQNIRLEPQLKREMFQNVQPGVRSALKRMTKER